MCGYTKSSTNLWLQRRVGEGAPPPPDAVGDARVAEEVDVKRRQVQRQRRHRRLELVQLLLRQLVPLHHDRPQPVRVHGAGGEPRRLQDRLYLLAFNRLVRLKESDGATAPHDLLELHGLPPW